MDTPAILFARRVVNDFLYVIEFKSRLEYEVVQRKNELLRLLSFGNTSSENNKLRIKLKEVEIEMAEYSVRAHIDENMNPEKTKEFNDACLVLNN